MLRRMMLSDARMAALFLVSVCVLAFEIEVMRVFAVSSWSNFGSMVISIALLGFGLAGTLLTLLENRIRANPDAWLASSAFALGPSMAAAHTLAQQVPFNPVLIATDPSQLWWIALFYLLYGIPFFAGGLFIGVMFATLASRAHKVYFWNMLGSGLGGLLILAFMFIFPPSFLIYPLVGIAILPGLLCCMRWSAADDRFRIQLFEAVLFLVVTAVSFLLLGRFGSLNVSDFKPESYARKYPDSTLVYDAFSPLGETRVFSSSYFHFAPGLSDNAGVSLARMPQNAFLGMFVDGNGPVGVMRKLKSDEENYIDFLPMSAPYILFSKPRVLLLRLGGGAGVHIALHNGARDVWVVESNPDVIRMLRDVPFFRQLGGDILRDPRARLVNAEVRSFAGSTDQRFDLVEIGLIDSIGLSQAGGYSVEENYVYTVEALQEYLKCLAPAGILSITVWDRLSPPRNVPKLLSTVVETLRRSGVPHPEKRIFAFNLLLSTATVLVKNADFTAAEIEKLKEYCRRMSFEPDYYGGIPQGTKDFEQILAGYRGIYSDDNPAEAAAGGAPEADLRPGDLYHYSLEWMIAGRQEELYSKYIFDIRPATDDKPYYSGYLKPVTIPLFVAHAGEISEEWGYLLLLATFLQSVIFGALIIVLPLATRWRELFKGRRGTLGVIVYYGCLGIGYMMAEIFLIQRFVFFLADPVYANAIVITVLLISSGVGGLVAGRLSAVRRAAVIAGVAGIVGFALFYHFGLPSILRAGLGLPLTLKALLAAALIAPLGIFLGMPFPTGLAALSERRRSILPWAWGMNGALSVTGSVLTRIISTSIGFSAVLIGMAALYVLAGLLFASNEAGLETGSIATSA
jgi:spermidine synthase